MPRLFATGSNGCGQLGIAHRNDVSRLTPCVFSGDEPLQDGSIVSLVSGGNHSLLLLATSQGRSIWATGTNVQNQLGPGTSSSLDVWTPLDLLSLRRAAGLVENGTTYEPVAIACTWTSTLIAFSRTLNTNGRRRSDVVLSFGSNDFGELGCGSIGTSAESTGKVHNVRLPGSDGRGSGSRMEIQHLATGQRHVVCSCVFSKDGVQEQRVYGWGAARHGQLDVSSYYDSADGPNTAGPSRQPARRVSKYSVTILLPTTLDLSALLPTNTHITKITCGTSHTVLRLSTGTLITLGSNAKHQRDVPPSCEDVACTWNGTVGWDEHGVWAVGSNTHGQLGQTTPTTPSSSPSRILIGDPSSPPNIQQLTCGSEHSLLLTQTGTLYAWGWNEHGNLGIGSLEDQWGAVEVLLPRDCGGETQRVRGMWAGCGTSWVLVDG
jgi:protein ATS1